MFGKMTKISLKKKEKKNCYAHVKFKKLNGILLF